MSYSFSVRADSKSDASAKVGAYLARVVEGQPSHAADINAAQNVADSLLAVLVDPAEGEEVYVSMSGSLSWREEGQFCGANVSVSTSVAKKETPAA